MTKKDYEVYYRLVWCTLRRIESGKHEDGTPLTLEMAAKMARLALNNAPPAEKVPAGYEWDFRPVDSTSLERQLSEVSA